MDFFKVIINWATGLGTGTSLLIQDMLSINILGIDFFTFFTIGGLMVFLDIAIVMWIIK